ncbi:uncharacterized protein LOC135523937 isoform X2 [Oncorhynchus masou masou]|uniref:uncharacterized protein LOC135523937 isoform X2 n=1 Tax=Oncorhynchus masou masou TaxID=90313 RepID=UPI0031837B08
MENKVWGMVVQIKGERMETVPILAKTLKDVALNRSPTSTPRNSRAISTPKKITGTIPRTSTLELPATTTAPPTSMPTTASAAQTTPAQLQSHPDEASHPPTPHCRPTLGGATAQQAQAVRGATGPAPTNQMSDIKHAESTMLTCDRPRVMVTNGTRCVTGSGLADGEQMERLWSYVRTFVKITKEMIPTHRVDALKDALYYASRVREKQGSTQSDVEVWTRQMKETLTDKKTLFLTWQERCVETLAEQQWTNHCCAALQKNQADIGENKTADQRLKMLNMCLRAAEERYTIQADLHNGLLYCQQELGLFKDAEHVKCRTYLSSSKHFQMLADDGSVSTDVKEDSESEDESG